MLREVQSVQQYIEAGAQDAQEELQDTQAGPQYTQAELLDAQAALQSSLRKIEKVLVTLSKKDPPPKAQLTLADRNLRALRLALSLIEKEMCTMICSD